MLLKNRNQRTRLLHETGDRETNRDKRGGPENSGFRPHSIAYITPEKSQACRDGESMCEGHAEGHAHVVR